MSKNLGQIAENYAKKLGFYVFPLKERAKVPATKNGFYSASNEPEIVRGLWELNSRYNIGLRTGEESGVFVLDIDGDAGESELKAFECENSKLPITTCQKTSNGRHLIFKYPKDCVIGNRCRIVRNGQEIGGLDIRGTGGYIVLAPSIHPDTGNSYEWINKPTTTPPADAPEWLINLIKKKETTSIAPIQTQVVSSLSRKSTSPDAIISDQIASIQQAQEGCRNDTLNIAALKCGRVVAGCPEVGESKVLNCLLQAALASGLDHAESEATIMSGFNAGLKQPYNYGGLDKYEHPKQSKELAQKEHINSVPFIKPLPFLSIQDVLSRPKTEWLIKSIFPKESFGVIYGAPKKGKSFVALDMGLCVALGRDWAGHECKQGAVLYIAGEGVGGLPRRLKAWLAHNDEDGKDIPFLILPSAVNFMKQECVDGLVQQVLETGLDFSLIFVDTVARSILGADENSSEHMGFFVAACDAIKEATMATVIGIHHSGKDEERGMRGSSALLGAVDTCLAVTREENTITIKMEAQKDGEEIDDICFNMVNMVTGIDETSIALELVDKKVHDKKIKLTMKEQKALQILNDSISQSTYLLRGFPACNLEVWREDCYRRELTYGTLETKRSGFRSVLNSLDNKGVIIVESGLVMTKDAVKRMDSENV